MAAGVIRALLRRVNRYDVISLDDRAIVPGGARPPAMLADAGPRRRRGERAGHAGHGGDHHQDRRRGGRLITSSAPSFAVAPGGRSRRERHSH